MAGSTIPLVLGVGALGWLLTRTGADGISMIDRIASFGVKTSPATAADLPGAAASASASGSGPDFFNFNASDSNALYREGSATLEGHAGFGHVGPGGIVTLVVEERDAGLVGAALGGNYSVVYQTTVSLQNDADWTGYGVDFSGVDVGSGNAGLFHTVEVRYSIAIGSRSTGTSLVLVAPRMV